MSLNVRLSFCATHKGLGYSLDFSKGGHYLRTYRVPSALEYQDQAKHA